MLARREFLAFLAAGALAAGAKLPVGFPTETAFAEAPEQETLLNIFVNTHLKTGLNDGSSWANAFWSMSTALAKAEPGSNIWTKENRLKESIQLPYDDPKMTFIGCELGPGFEIKTTGKAIAGCNSMPA